jgi:metal-dependent hydrolase (beta-lactamase superfamily II)
MTEGRTLADKLETLDSLSVAVLTDDVSDNYVSKTSFAVSEFSNVVLGGASVISGEALLCANLGFGLRLVSNAGGKRHTMLFDTGPEGPIFMRNCTNLGIRLGEVEAIAVTHGHWDHMAALPSVLLDERMLVAKVHGLGLIVFSTCSHAGIVNVCKHAKTLFPDIPIHAVMGGPHLGGVMERNIPDTVDGLRPFNIGFSDRYKA